METPFRSFMPRRLRNIVSVTSLIAVGMVATGLIVSAHATTGDGSASAEDDASGWVNGPFPCFTPRPTPCPGRCSQLVVLAQNFDNVAPPILPPDWLATNVLGPPPLWVTSDSGLPMPPADTPPNAAFVDDPGLVSDKGSIRCTFLFRGLQYICSSSTISISKRRTWTQTLDSMEAFWR